MSVFLVLLLLSNSSLALEILTHDAHQHTEPHASELAAHPQHSMPGIDMASTMSEAPAHGGDDCVCDDICCLTSIDLGLNALDEQFVLDSKSPTLDLNFYLSVSLDLFLPPPTR